MKEKPTAGELANKALSDNTKYDLIEVGEAVSNDIESHLAECIKRHNEIFDMDEYCVCFVLAGDPLLKNLVRRKFFALPFLPSPRPGQTVFLYNKRLDKITKRLWVLPDAHTMEALYLTPHPGPAWKSMKQWSQAFYDGCFFEFIRKQHDIDMLSESEMIKAQENEAKSLMPKESIESTTDDGKSPIPKTFDFTKIRPKDVIDSNTIICH